MSYSNKVLKSGLSFFLLIQLLPIFFPAQGGIHVAKALPATEKNLRCGFHKRDVGKAATSEDASSFVDFTNEFIRLPDIIDQVFDEVENIIYYPVGLIPTLTLLHKLAKPGTASSKELKMLIGDTVAKASIADVKSFRESSIKLLGINSVNVFYQPAAAGKPSEMLMSALEDTSTHLVRSTTEFQGYIKKEITKRAPDYKPKEDEHVLLNFMDMKVKWLYSFQREAKARSFFPGHEGKVPLTNYMKLSMDFAVVKTDAYIAFKLELATPENKPHETLTAYIIASSEILRLPDMSSKLLKEVHGKLSQVEKPSPHTITMPAFDVGKILRFPESNVKGLLRKDNKDFPDVAETVKFKVEHISTLCADQFGGTKAKAAEDKSGNEEADKNKIDVNSHFHFVIVDKNTGAPYMVSRVHNVLENNDTC